MKQLPIDTRIGECLAYHEGNHRDNGNPHNQYISKFATLRIPSVKEDVGNWYKIAKIEYIPNNNVEFRYKIGLYPIKNHNDYEIDLLCKPSISDTQLSMKTDGALYCKVKAYNGIDDNSNATNIYELYVQVNRSWFEIPMKLLLSTNNLYYHYNEDYAFRKIDMLDGTERVSDVSTDIKTIYNFYSNYMTVENEPKTVSSHSTETIALTVPGANWETFVSLMPCGNIPLEFGWSFSIPYTDRINIYVRNYNDYSKEFPKLKWNVKLTKFK